ncbi:MAG TPA: S9 family peptidase [Bacteroidales bacterium]|nr:S9 family peptidase [Bacteroidales bacterium]HPS63395.1 S9 family peptidase [Bacteroidales bacterium]
MVRLSTLLLLLLTLPALSQERLLTVEEATGMNPKLIPSNLSQLQWLPDDDHFVLVARNSLVRGSTESTFRDTLVRLGQLNTLLVINNFDTLKRFPTVTFLSNNKFRFISGNKLYVVDINANTVSQANSWDEKAENLDISDEGFSAAYTLENNLYLARSGKFVAITNESNKGIVYGSNRVHRNEFGIDKGTFWSPDGKKLAFYRMDETMVTEYPLVDMTTRIATVAPTRYPMAGMKSHEVTVGVYSLETGTTIYLRTEADPKEDSAQRMVYLTNITWSPDDKSIFIATLNRDQNHMKLNRYDATTGEFKATLFEEKDEAYVEPLHGPRFLPGNDRQFIWESRRDGFNHLYLYDTDGNLLKQLTHGEWEVTDLIRTDKSGSYAWFTCNKDNPVERQVFRCDLKKGTVDPVTTQPGTHSAQVSANGRFIIDSWSNTDVARQIDLLDRDGTWKQALLQNENPLREFNLGETSIFTLKSDDNQALYCRLIKPAGFDPSKRYPVIIYVYGGPHSQLVTNTWLSGAGLFLNYLAEKGYVVFTLDNRGTSNRGKAFEQAIFRHLGDKEVSDQMVGVNYLKSLPFVDSTRIGINGWSYGGFMTLSMVLRHPGTFKVAVCGGPVTDWKYYEVMYGERYMDTPQSNPGGYRDACLVDKVKDLTGKVLIIHDDQDGTVVPQNSFSFLKKCVDEGKQVDFFMYPGHEHNVRGKDRVHLNRKMTGYFFDNL